MVMGQKLWVMDRGLRLRLKLGLGLGSGLGFGLSDFAILNANI